MDRRKFIGLFSAGIAGVALDHAIPFNRVWSFPKEIIVPRLVPGDVFSIASVNMINPPGAPQMFFLARNGDFYVWPTNETRPMKISVRIRT